MYRSVFCVCLMHLSAGMEYPVERAAKADVDDLHALADAEHRLFAPQRFLEKPQVIGVDLPHGVPLALDAFFPVEDRIHVRAAGEDDGIAERRMGPDHIRVRAHRQEQGDAPRLLHAGRIVCVDILPQVPGEHTVVSMGVRLPDIPIIGLRIFLLLLTVFLSEINIEEYAHYRDDQPRQRCHRILQQVVDHQAHKEDDRDDDRDRIEPYFVGSLQIGYLRLYTKTAVTARQLKSMPQNTTRDVS